MYFICFPLGERCQYLICTTYDYRLKTGYTHAEDDTFYSKTTSNVQASKIYG